MQRGPGLRKVVKLIRPVKLIKLVITKPLDPCIPIRYVRRDGRIISIFNLIVIASRDGA